MSIPVYDGEEIVGEVEYNSNLDYWDGNNYTCGATGRHKGLEKFGDNYALIHGTQWQGEKETAELITPEQAVQEILRSGNTELFDGVFKELRAIREGLKPKRGKDAQLTIRISTDQKNRWQGMAEAEGLSLTELIVKRMEGNHRALKEEKK